MAKGVHHWYIVHASAGSENRVASELQAQFNKAGLEESVSKILVPKKSVTTVRRGVKVEVEERILPGYILIHMECTPETLHLLRHTPRVIEILGSQAGGVPNSLSDEEVNHLLGRLETISKVPQSYDSFSVGDIVKVGQGFFESMEGVVEEVDLNRMRLKVSVVILGRPTPVDLEFAHVKKVE